MASPARSLGAGLITILNKQENRVQPAVAGGFHLRDLGRLASWDAKLTQDDPSFPSSCSPLDWQSGRVRRLRAFLAALRPAGKQAYNTKMSTQELLIEEIKRQPEPVQREMLHFLRFLVLQREDARWADVLPDREVEQEVLSILDGQESETR